MQLHLLMLLSQITSLFSVPINRFIIIALCSCLLYQIGKRSYRQKIHEYFYIYLYQWTLPLHVDFSYSSVFSSQPEAFLWHFLQLAQILLTYECSFLSFAFKIFTLSLAVFTKDLSVLQFCNSQCSKFIRILYIKFIFLIMCGFKHIWCFSKTILLFPKGRISIFT